MSATGRLWRAIGEPDVVGCSRVFPTRCYVCGDEMAAGQSLSDWMGGNYTDQMRVAYPQGDMVCTACVMVTQRTFPVPGRPPKEGKSAGGNFRNYSHLYEEGWITPVYGDDGRAGRSYANASKGQKPLIREFLGRVHTGPWFAAIADSGQKHVVHFAPVNGPGRAGMVIFEERIFWWDGDTRLLNDMTALLTLHVTKDEISSGAYRSQTWRSMRVAVTQFEEMYSGQRGSDRFDLCIWLAQRDEDKVDERNKNTRNKSTNRKRAGGDDLGAKERLPKSRSKPTGPLDTVGEPLPSSCNANGDSKRMGESGAKKAADPQPEQGQLGLFGRAGENVRH